VLEEILAPDVSHDAGTIADNPGPHAVMQILLTGFPDVTHTVDDVIAQDDRVVIRYTAVGTQTGPFQGLPPGDRQVSWTGINIYRFACGRIVEVWSEVDCLGRLTQLLRAGAVEFPTGAPPVTPGAIRTVDVVSTLRAAGLSVEQNQRLFVPQREFEVPGQGIMVEGALMLLFVFPDRAADGAAFAAADPANVLPERLAGAGELDVADVMLAQGSNVVVALAGGDDRTWEIVKATIEGLP
jgi:hypothetical protein